MLPNFRNAFAWVTIMIVHAYLNTMCLCSAFINAPSTLLVSRRCNYRSAFGHCSTTYAGSLHKHPQNALSSRYSNAGIDEDDENVGGDDEGESNTLLGDGNQKDKPNSYYSEVPLVFIPGMKGSHLSFMDENQGEDDSQTSNVKLIRENANKRVWLSFGNLINFPPKPDYCAERSLALPLTYTERNGTVYQDRGPLRPDGVVESIIEFGKNMKSGDLNNSGGKAATPSLELFPFYGHAVQHILNEDLSKRPNAACFTYDWRRSLEDLTQELEEFCETKFPGKPVQVVAHSMGGLLAFGAMRRNPDKFAPGGIFAGVPFGTGIQYFQDLHRGYFTELNRCRQFMPKDTFTMSSHWSFFPQSKEEGKGLFVDVTGQENVTFVADKSAIGKAGTEFKLDPVLGTDIDVDFYDVDEWERLEVGVFDPTLKLDEETKLAYKQHMKIQLEKAENWRNTVHKAKDHNEALPPLVVCATDKVPTINQILRRKRIKKQASKKARKSARENPRAVVVPDVLSNVPKLPLAEGQMSSDCTWEYDYISGRSVQGDGRIDFDKAFPPDNVYHKRVRLDSTHAKQLCWGDSGGSFDIIWKETIKQIAQYEENLKLEQIRRQVEAIKTVESNFESSMRRRLWPKRILLARAARRQKIQQEQKRSSSKYPFSRRRVRRLGRKKAQS